MEHTKTPWYGNGRAIVTAFCQKEICLCHAEDEFPEDIAYANAAFIVRAVNSHEKLVEALKRWYKFAKDNHWTDEDFHDCDGSGWVSMTRSALALAEK